MHNLPLMPLLCGDNLPDQHGAVEVPAPHRLSAVHPQAVGATATSSTRSTKAGSRARPTIRSCPIRRRRRRPGASSIAACCRNVLGGAFCPGARGQLDHAQPVDLLGAVPHQGRPLGVELPGDRRAGEHRRPACRSDYTFNVENPLSQDNNFDVGLQPGDMTKYMAVPWQADFNECTTNPTDVTYADWNIHLSGQRARHPHEARNRKVVRHHVVAGASPAAIRAGRLGQPERQGRTTCGLNWSSGVPQTNAGDLKMVTEWENLALHHPQPATSRPRRRARHLPISPARRATSASSRTSGG